MLFVHKPAGAMDIRYSIFICVGQNPFEWARQEFRTPFPWERQQFEPATFATSRRRPNLLGAPFVSATKRGLTRPQAHWFVSCECYLNALMGRAGFSSTVPERNGMCLRTCDLNRVRVAS